MTLLRSTVSGNQSGFGGGGAIFNFAGVLTITNSTISGNSSAGPGGGVLIRSGGSLNTLNATITDNTASTGLGGGIDEEDGFVELHNSLLAANLPADCDGLIDSLDNNLDSDNTCKLDEANDLPGQDARLGPLAFNGGRTLTHALLAGSPASDAALSITAPDTDQRGLGRLGAADIGSFELQEADEPAQLVFNLSLGWDSIVFTGADGILPSELADLIAPALIAILRFDPDQDTWLIFRPDAPIPQLNTLNTRSQGDALFLRLTAAATLTLPDLLLFATIEAPLGPGFTYIGFTGADATDLADLLNGLPQITAAFVFDQLTQGWLLFRPGQPAFLSSVTSVDRLTGIFLFNDSPSTQMLFWDQRPAFPN